MTLKEYNPPRLPPLLKSDEDGVKIQYPPILSFRAKWEAVLKLKEKRHEDFKLSKKKPLRCPTAGCYFRTAITANLRQHIRIHEKFDQRVNQDENYQVPDDIHRVQVWGKTKNNDISAFADSNNNNSSLAIVEVQSSIVPESDESVELQCGICNFLCVGVEAAMKHADQHDTVNLDQPEV